MATMIREDPADRLITESCSCDLNKKVLSKCSILTTTLGTFHFVKSMVLKI